MDEIKRYDCELVSQPWDTCAAEMTEDTNGEWVKFAGHQAESSRLAARVAELEGLLRSHRSALICDNLHHSSKQYHLASQACPVEAEIDLILAGKEVGNG